MAAYYQKIKKMGEEMIMTTDKLEYAKTKTQVYTYIVRVTYFLILILSHWDCTLILIHPIPIILHTDTHKKNLIFLFFLTQKDTIFCFFSFQYYQPTISSLLISSFFLAFFLNITTRKNGYCSQCCSDTPFL